MRPLALQGGQRERQTGSARRHRTACLVASALVGLLVAVTGCARRHAAEPTVTSKPVAASATVSIVLFFVGEDGRLQRETREVGELPEATQPRVRLVLDELLGGSRTGLASPVPWAVTVQTVFADKNGAVFVDLSAPPQPTIAGTSSEAAFIYSIVNSVVANCPGVARVQLLFGGRELATLGNLDLRRPLTPNLDVVAP